MLLSHFVYVYLLQLPVSMVPGVYNVLLWKIHPTVELL